MSQPRGIGRRGPRSIPLLALLALLFAVLAPAATLAHPLDEFPQATYLTVAATRIEVELDLTPGVLVALRILPAIDTDGDQVVADAEGRAYVASVLREVALRVDGQPLALVVDRIELPPYLNFQAGYGTIRVFATAEVADGTTGTRRLYYTSNYAPAGAVHQVNAFVAEGAAIALGPQNRDDAQQRLALDYAIGAAAPAAAEPVEAVIETAPAATEQAQRLLASLDAPVLSRWTVALALAVAVVLGGPHALTPGHGKTLVAAYLVGGRGTARHAVALGAIVTFTPTASVVVIGLLALFASRFIVPNLLVPVLQILSGVLVVGLGARLVRQRWAAFRRRRDSAPSGTDTHAHSHDAGHHHAHDHAHEGA